MVERLRAWFRGHQRDLPWRRDRSPYAVWISEVMLQQTQASVVVPYFVRWMERFPNPQALAEASIEEVLKMWEGLGYYSRARNLHAGACYLVHHHGGEVPSSEEALRKIKGLGDYTIGAILGLAFHQRTVAIDGNVLRVSARLFAIEEDMGKASARQTVRKKLVEFLPLEAPWEVGEALIELGARICTKRPACHLCPLQPSCEGHRLGIEEKLPLKMRRTPYTTLRRAVAVIRCEELLLVQRVQAGRVMADLYEFPYFELEEPPLDAWEVQERVQRVLGLTVVTQRPLTETHHSFTRYRVRLYPWVFGATETPPIEGYTWVASSALVALPFSAGHRRIFTQLNRRQGPLLPNLEPGGQQTLD